jgi:cyclic pyranopterin phosphate synthase
VSNLPFATIQAIAEEWLLTGGRAEADLAALEPTLWADGTKNIYDVIKLLSDIGYIVNMTTNGSTLASLGKSLKDCGLNKLRISWNTLDKNTYKDLTSRGNYDNFINGIHIAIKHSENICFNRLLINGYTDDIEEQIYFIDKYGLRLKLYDLIWTKNIDNYYKQFYISPEEVISSIKILNSFRCEIVKPQKKRERLCYIGPNGGKIEVKSSNSANKQTDFCRRCIQSSNCLEGFGDYFRIFPTGMA